MSAPGTNTAYVKQVTDAGVAIVTLDHHPVNSLSAQVHNAMADCRDELHAAVVAGTVSAVVLVGAGRAFCAGADISQQGSAPPVERRRQEPLDPANPAAGLSYAFVGLMDSIKLFNRALSDEEIAQLAVGRLGSDAILQCNGGSSMVTMTSSHVSCKQGFVACVQLYVG